jgi:hypothetical protein
MERLGKVKETGVRRRVGFSYQQIDALGSCPGSATRSVKASLDAVGDFAVRLVVQPQFLPV